MRLLLSSGESDDHELGFLLTCQTLAESWVEPERDVLPDGLESIPIGPFLAAVVGSVDRSRVNGPDAIRLMQAEARIASAFEAAKLATVAEVAHCPPGDADAPVERSPSEVEYAAVEIAAALTLTRRTAESLLETALTLAGRLRRVWSRFASGVLDMHKTRELVRQLGHLDREVVDEVLDRTLDRAPGLTTGQLRTLVSRRVMEVDPDGAASGLAEGLKERRVITYPNPDLTGTLTIQSAPPLEVGRAMAHIDEVARSIERDGDDRTLDEIRADVALDLLQGKCLCGSAGSSPGGVHLEVELATLAEQSDNPGELAGYGPVIAEIARKTAISQSDGEWDYEVTDNGRVVPPAGCDGDPTPHRSDISRPSTTPAPSSDAACRPTSATSTTAAPTPKADRPTTTTSRLCAGTITWHATTHPGSCNACPTEAIAGPALSDTATSAPGPRPTEDARWSAVISADGAHPPP